METQTIEAVPMEETLAKNWAEISAKYEEAPRDEGGKFASKTPVIGENKIGEEAPAEPDAGTSEETQEAAATESKDAQKSEGIDLSKPPSSWNKVAAAEWANMPDAVRSQAIKRETDFHKGIEQYREKAQFGDTIRTAIAPHARTFEALGVTPEYGVKVLLDTDHALRYGSPQQKAEMLQKIALDYGVDIGAAQMPNDPNAIRLLQENSQLRAQIQNQSFMQQSQSTQALNSTIQEFARDKEHFEAVRAPMAALLQAGEAKDLNDAYEKAIWANPDIRKSLLAKQQEEEKAERTRKAEEAKKAGKVNVPTRGKLPSAKPIGTMDDTIREEAKRLGLTT